MNFLSLLRLTSPLSGLVLASCAGVSPDEEVAVVEPPVDAVKKVEQVEAVVEEPSPSLRTEGLRLPGGLLELPDEAELRTPVTQKPRVGAGTLVVRPPAEAPPRPPKDPEVATPGEN